MSQMSKTTRILVADDANTIRRLLKNTLRDVGFELVDDANNGKVALELLLKNYENKTPYEILIIDWNMPLMTGMELLKFVRSQPQFENLPFVMLTSENQMELVAECVNAGVSQYVIKPFTNNMIMDKINRAWSKHHPK